MLTTLPLKQHEKVDHLFLVQMTDLGQLCQYTKCVNSVTKIGQNDLS